MGRSPGDEPLAFMKCYSYEMSPPYEAQEGRKSVWPTPQLKSIKTKISFFISFRFTNLLLLLISWHDA